MRLDDDAASRTTALAAAAQALHLDGLAGRLLSDLEARGIAAILLKGAVIARWLYTSGEVRTYGDVDVLVDPRRLRDARIVVDRVAEPESVDLHESIPGIGAAPRRAFGVLLARTVPVHIGGVDGRMLDEAARTLHVALHAGWHGPFETGPLRDLELAVERVDVATWRAAADLARELAALPSFVVGLEQTESGRALRRELGLPKLETMRSRIGFGEASVPAKRLAELHLAEGWRARAHVVRLIAFPSRFEMNRRYPEEAPARFPAVRVHMRRMSRRLREVPSAIRLLRRKG